MKIKKNLKNWTDYKHWLTVRIRQKAQTQNYCVPKTIYLYFENSNKKAQARKTKTLQLNLRITVSYYENYK